MTPEVKKRLERARALSPTGIMRDMKRHGLLKLSLALLTKLVDPTREAIAKHVAKIRREFQEGKKPGYRSLKERTGLKFGSGTARAFRRRHAKRVLVMGKKGLV